MERREGLGSTGEYQEAVVDWIQAMLSLLSSTGLREFILRDHQKAHLVKSIQYCLLQHWEQGKHERSYQLLPLYGKRYDTTQ